MIKKYLVMLFLAVMIVGSFNNEVHAESRYVLSGDTKLIYVIPQDDLGILFWTRAAWVNANYFEDVTSTYAGGERYTSSYKRTVYGDMDIVYDGDYSVMPLFTVEYSTSSTSYITPPLTKKEATIGGPNFISRYDDETVDLTGSSPKGETTVSYSVPDAVVPVQSVTVSLELD